ncbi:MAG TPA: hypothetical protein VHS09_12790, partial [Polyangiaceae bacterium]|nr:hypothetical protein [Polyangiaceae bacterium]
MGIADIAQPSWNATDSAFQVSPAPGYENPYAPAPAPPPAPAQPPPAPPAGIYQGMSPSEAAAARNSLLSQRAAGRLSDEDTQRALAALPPVAPGTALPPSAPGPAAPG